MNRILIALVCASVAMTANAATTKKTTTKKTTTTTTTTTNSKRSSSQPVYRTTDESSSYSGSNESGVRFGATASLGMVDGNFGFGAGFRADFPVKLESLALRVGGETGIYRFSNSGITTLVFPIIGTATYNIHLSNNPGITPFVRAGLGIDIAHTSGSPSVTVLGTTVTGASVSDTNVKFHFQAEPGIEFYNNKLFASIPFGTMAGGFLLMPTFGIHF